VSKILRHVLLQALPLLVAACVGNSPTNLEQAAPSTWALAGSNGALTVTATQTLNQYAVLATNAVVGTNTVTVTNLNDLTSPAGALAVGDLLLLIQVQGAEIDPINSANYGRVLRVNGAGLYEFVMVTGVGGGATGQDITVDHSCGGLQNSYLAAGRTQVIRVPQYSSGVVSTTGKVTAPAWDGQRGGVIALHVNQTLTVDGKIDVTGLGFRGGKLDPISQPIPQDVPVYSSPASADGAEKGESIAGDSSTYDILGGRYGRGAPGNGGGGGNSHNAAGGGGANGNNGINWTGQGNMDGTVVGAAAWALDPIYIANGNKLTVSSGGGRGGYSYSFSDQDAFTVSPGDSRWGGNFRRERGGMGGHPLNNDPAGHLFMGGGGGAGDQNDNSGGAGGNGGGIVFILANNLTGVGQVLASGANGGTTINNHNDGAGGGGGGGSVVIRANTLSSLGVVANGGTGGLQKIFSLAVEAEGPGGGGGGGFVSTRGGSIPISVAGGLAGSTTSNAVAEFRTNGATNAAPGNAVENNLAEVVACIPADLAITITDNQSTSAPGEKVTYVVTVTNKGINAAFGTNVTTSLPPTLGSLSWTCTGTNGGVCTATSGVGSLNGFADLPVGASVTFAVKGTISLTATDTLDVSATVTAPGQVTDFDLSNNTATDSDFLVPKADVAVKITTSPKPVVSPGATLTYTLAVTNLGPSIATGLTLTDTLPTLGTLLSISGNGWNCTVTNGEATCLLSMLAPGTTSNITIAVQAPSGGTLVDAATLFSETADPDFTNNSANNSTVVNSIADLSVTLGAAAPQVFATQPLNFTAAVSNIGPQVAKQVTLSLPLPAGTSFINATGTGWTCGLNGNTVACTRSVLVPGGSPPITVQLNMPAQSGDLPVTANVSATSYDPNDANDASTVTVKVLAQADLSVTLQATPEPALPGSPLTFTLSPSNAGPSTAGPVTVTLTLPPGSDFQSATGDGWRCIVNGAALVCTRDTAPPGPLPSIAVVFGTPPDGGVTYSGTVSISSGARDPNPANDVVNYEVSIPVRQLSATGSGCNATGEGGSLGLLAVLTLAVGLSRSRRTRASSRRLSNKMSQAALGMMLIFRASGEAQAQTDIPLSKAFDIQQFQPGPGASDLGNVLGAGVPDALRWQLGAFVNFAHDPLVIRDQLTGSKSSPLVSGQTELDLLASVGLFGRGELGVAFPLTLQQVGVNASVIDRVGSTFSGGGMGDFRIVPKVLLWEQSQFRVGIAAPVLLPSGGGASFRSQAGAQVKPRLLVDYGGAGGLRLLANLGVNLRPEQRFLDLTIGNELAYGFAAESPLPFRLATHLVQAQILISGAWGLKTASAGQGPLELGLGARARFTDALEATVGVGKGLTRGYGTPDFRAFVGFTYVAPPPPPPPPAAPPAPVEPAQPSPVPQPPPQQPLQPETPKDTDGDGIPDDQDKCPTQPEVYNNFQDEDGCPDQGPGVKVEGRKIATFEQVHFATNEDVVLKDSYPLLGEVARVLKRDSWIRRVLIEGHTDNQGDILFNVDLSRRRARNVMRKLLEDGIEPERLEYEGYGASRPIDTNDTPKGRENNRRVEFTILKTDERSAGSKGRPAAFPPPGASGPVAPTGGMSTTPSPTPPSPTRPVPAPPSMAPTGTTRPGTMPPRPMPPGAPAPGTTAPGTTAPGTTAPGTLPRGTPAPGTPAPGTPAPGTPAPGAPAPGTLPRGTPAPGTPAPGTPAPGTPAPGTPAPGAPAPGTPAPGTLAPGTPPRGTPAPGAPAPGTPPRGTPAPGTPAPGTPPPGTPAPGTPAPGTPAPVTPPGRATSAGTTPPGAMPLRPTTPVTAPPQRGAPPGAGAPPAARATPATLPAPATAPSPAKPGVQSAAPAPKPVATPAGGRTP